MPDAFHVDDETESFDDSTSLTSESAGLALDSVSEGIPGLVVGGVVAVGAAAIGLWGRRRRRSVGGGSS